jgi:hypothetical protein
MDAELAEADEEEDAAVIRWRGRMEGWRSLIMVLVADGIHIGWLLALPGAPVAGLTGYLLARRLAKKLA